MSHSQLPPLLPLLLLTFGLAFLLLAIALKTGIAGYLAMDQPNQRSLHSVAIPRVGGIAIVVAVLAAWSLLPQAPPLLMLLTAALAAISYTDDRKGLAVSVRLASHGAAALTMVLSGLAGSGQGAWIAAGAAAYAVWMTNAYNFMDGADGLAGGMAIFGFSAYGIAASAAHAEPLAGMSFILAAAAGAFVCFNFPPAKVFMGDAGSISLGFLAAALGLSGWQAGAWPPWFPLLVFSPFLVDASLTLLRRVLRGERFWEAHRDHYYQRLIRMGWSHRRTALAEYALMAGVAASALAGLSVGQGMQLLILAGWAITYASMLSAVDIRWRRFVRLVNPVATVNSGNPNL
ncbi:MAG: glycosyltransferase family 4 protein [Sterolibacterium sp.]|jgi:UDP-N-acetylmuramyl pentapeptide phosphotransferase/UDP-N-acetylglucosamine-1-phosphate transferase